MEFFFSTASLKKRLIRNGFAVLLMLAMFFQAPYMPISYSEETTTAVQIIDITDLTTQNEKSVTMGQYGDYIYHADRVNPEILPKPQSVNGDEELIPPLSIYDSGMMLLNAMEIMKSMELHEDGASRPEKDPINLNTLSRLDQMLWMSASYVYQIDLEHPFLTYYTWKDIASVKAPDHSIWTTQNFTLKTELKHVTAIWLRANHGDIEIKQISVVCKNGNRWEFRDALQIMGDQPKPEICYLPLSSEVVSIRLTYRQINADRKSARLFVKLGISEVPESAKACVYYLQQARSYLESGKFPDSLKLIKNAYKQLRDYEDQLKS